MLRASEGYIANLQLKAISHAEDITGSESTKQFMKSSENAVAAQTEVLMDLDGNAQDLRRQTGDFSVYSYYSRAGGHGTVIFMLVTVGLWVFCTEFSSTFSRLLPAFTAQLILPGSNHCRHVVRSQCRKPRACQRWLVPWLVHWYWVLGRGISVQRAVVSALFVLTLDTLTHGRRLIFITIISKTAKRLHEDLLKAAVRCVGTKKSTVYPEAN